MSNIPEEIKVKKAKIWAFSIVGALNWFVAGLHFGAGNLIICLLNVIPGLLMVILIASNIGEIKQLRRAKIINDFLTN